MDITAKDKIAKVLEKLLGGKEKIKLARSNSELALANFYKDHIKLGEYEIKNEKGDVVSRVPVWKKVWTREKEKGKRYVETNKARSRRAD